MRGLPGLHQDLVVLQQSDGGLQLLVLLLQHAQELLLELGVVDAHRYVGVGVHRGQASRLLALLVVCLLAFVRIGGQDGLKSDGLGQQVLLLDIVLLVDAGTGQLLESLDFGLSVDELDVQLVNFLLQDFGVHRGVLLFLLQDLLQLLLVVLLQFASLLL